MGKWSSPGKTSARGAKLPIERQPHATIRDIVSDGVTSSTKLDIAAVKDFGGELLAGAALALDEHVAAGSRGDTKTMEEGTVASRSETD